ncbi:transglycosylase family protein [Streptomyces cellulosae]|uniref:transglycosylase family protein n=1 Tax=Streptomyces cellulosae TaxID=1968 RepID=UPI0004C5DA3D|nr:transglycosylase family protein [Streptomyces cellulosae]
MLSGNGRHRRPRQAPALLVAAGVTGTAIAIPLLAATGASAASGTTWDQVANCETGGSWSENSGDGYYGGLHIAQADWEKHGGLDYASRPDQASRNQQIAVAEKILADKGVGYWSTCGLLNGLSKDSASADVDTGLGGGGSDASSESDSPGLSDSGGLLSGSSGSSSSGATSGTPSPSASTPSSDASSGTSNSSDPADNPAKSDPSSDTSGSSGSAGSGPEAGGSQNPDDTSSGAAKQDNSGIPDNSWRVGGTSSLVDTGALDVTASGGKHRGDSAPEGALADTDDAGSSGGRHAARGDSYTVRVGDTLGSIADSLDLQGGWRALYEENKQAIGTDPSRITPGQTLGLGVE